MVEEAWGWFVRVQGVLRVNPWLTEGHGLRTVVTGRKVLCVGAGGIGCELLKTLVLTGFIDIEVVRPRLHAGICVRQTISLTHSCT